jgi:CubicO group peptidase (beta-lactamase class C family)
MRAVTLLLFLHTSALLYGQTPIQFAELTDRIEQAIVRQMQADRTPGASVAFMKDDFMWAKGFGYADLENMVPASGKSMYRLASVTKPMTAVAILQLAEQGKLALDAEVQTYVPYFPRKQWPVTVRQLLGHLGGISHYKDPAKELFIKEHKTTREAIAIFEDFALVAEPGTRYSYSSYGYNLLGAVIEGASGESYASYMRKFVWTPAGMTDTRLDDPREIIPNRVRGYELAGGEIRNSEFINISSRFAAGGLRATVIDMVRFARSLNDGTLLADSIVMMMYEPMVQKDGRLTTYSMGWNTSNLLGHHIVQHSGGQNETRTFLLSYPKKNLTVAVALNYESANPYTYASIVASTILDEPTTIQMYTGNKALDALALGMREVLWSGLAYYEKHGRALTTDTRELAAAFAFVNRTFNADSLTRRYDATVQKIQDGQHPVGHRVLMKAGSHMAATLAARHGEAFLEQYHKLGPIPFFHEYIRVYGSGTDIRREQRFNRQLERLVNDWNTDWEKTWTPEIRRLVITRESDPNELARILRFDRAKVYPNLVNGFADAVAANILAGDNERAQRMISLGIRLYPDSDVLAAYRGVIFLVGGKKEDGVKALQRSLRLNPRGGARAGNLNTIAYMLGGAGRTDAGLAVLGAAVRLHPTDANLHDSIGEFHLKKGDTTQAITWYRKALAIDPGFPSSKAAVERLTARQR